MRLTVGGHKVMIDFGRVSKFGGVNSMAGSKPVSGAIDFLAKFTGSEQFEKTFKVAPG